MSLLILIIPIGIIILMLVLLPVKILGWMIAFLIGVFPFYNIWIMRNCSGDCSIRIDLVILLPIILIMLITWGVRKYLAGRRNDTPTQESVRKN